MKNSPVDVYSLFEGSVDFLSATILGLETGDSLMPNLVADVGRAVKHLDKYVRIDYFFSRDDVGRGALEALEGYYDGRVCDRFALCDGRKDLNEYLQLTAKNGQ